MLLSLVYYNVGNYKSCLIILHHFFLIYKVDSSSSARFCQKNQEELQKKTLEKYQNVFEELKKKSDNIAVDDIKTFLNMKNRGCLTIEVK